MNRRWLWIIAAVLVAALAAPFVLNLAGDAQVHLAIAENFVHGRPFQYNPNGEIVVASTSPFWTMQLILFFRLAGEYAPVFLSAITVVIWLSAAYVLYRAARDLWHFEGVALWAVVLLWLLHTTIVANALGGLENVLSALQLLLIYVLSARYRSSLTVPRAAVLGGLLGWALLTRPDGGAFALALVVLFLLAAWPVSFSQLATLFGTALLVLAPWYAYQAAETGRLLTDSSVARLYNGRQGSLAIIPGRLYLHPKALVSLGSAFLPLSAGYVVQLVALLAAIIRAAGARFRWYREHYPQAAAVILVAVGLGFYTFVVGAEAFGRYFLPLFPFLFLAGVGGWKELYGWLAARGRERWAVGLVGLALLFMVATSGLDAYRRLVPGNFASDRVLNVIYGPANRQYFSVNLPALVAAPRNRPAATDELLGDLGATPADAPISIAVTEVQLRYFVDERVEVISLDGRTSADIFAYIDPDTGVPDFERYFLDVQPDYVHAAQWCEVGGWLAGVFSSTIEENLVCHWEKLAGEMQPGDTFLWQDHPVTLVAPQIFHIDWSSGP
ncbi:MAG: hypothetical protein R3C44_09910 [Chloroflexota bacterium]